MEARTKNILTGEYEWFFLKGVPRFDGDKIVGYIGTGYNIQKLKTQMVELIESETRFRKLADNIQNLAWMANGDGWIFWYNKRWYEYTGTTLEEMQGSGWEKVHHPNNVQSVVDFVSEAWTKNKPWELTFPLRGADGEYKWFLTSAFPITNQNGEIIRWIGTNTDINEQKKAEEQFRILADEAPMWVWMTDSEANIIYANKEQLRFLKLQHFSEFTSDRWKDLVHPDDVSVVLNAFLNASKNHQPYSVEVRFKNPATGIYEWILFKGVPRIDGNTLIGFIGTASNIHQQKTHIEILQSREERFRMLAESLPHLVWMTDANGKQEFTNNRWKEYSGIEPEGEKTWKMMVHPDDESVINAAWANSITNGVFYKSEVRLKNKNGIYRWHYVIGEPIKSADGKIINWIGAFTEIHDQKTVNENLEILVNDRTIELRKVNEILVGKNIELNNTQHFLQTVLDASVDLVAAFDVNLNYTYINKRKQEFIKKSMEEIIGKNILDIYPDLEFTEAYEHMKKALRGEKIREKKRRSLSKENTILEFYFPLFNGIDVIGMVTLSRDITAKNEEE